MIFGRKKRSAEPEADLEDLTDDEAVQDEVDEAEEDSAEPDTGTDADADAGPAIDLDALDATEWRTDGPFDVTELHDDADDADDNSDDNSDDAVDGEGAGTPGEGPRIDLGSLILHPPVGSELRLQVNEAQTIVSAMLVLPIVGPPTDGADPEVVSSSALELSAYAAPRSGGLWAELRDEISEAATESGGSAELAEGPFGVELRRLLPVTTPTGEQGYQPSRMWVAEGPRWLLRGIVYGQAAIELDEEAPAVAAVVDAFRSVLVRRSDEAMAPGDLLAMTMPADLQPSG